VLGSFPMLVLMVLVFISLKVFIINATEQIQKQGGVSNMNSQKCKKFLVATVEVSLAIATSIVATVLLA